MTVSMIRETNDTRITTIISKSVIIEVFWTSVKSAADA